MLEETWPDYAISRTNGYQILAMLCHPGEELLSYIKKEKGDEIKCLYSS